MWLHAYKHLVSKFLIQEDVLCIDMSFVCNSLLLKMYQYTAQVLEPLGCKTSIIDACMHITTDNINSEFYSSICQHHINCSIHVFIIRDAIIFNMYT